MVEGRGKGRRNRRAFAILGLFLGILLMAVGTLRKMRHPDAVALVNGKPISRESFLKISEHLRKEQGKESLSQEEKKRLLDTLVNEEVLFQEGERQRLLHQDPVIRRRVIQLVLLQAEAASPTPSREELKSYYEHHRTRYMQPEQVKFWQLFFPLEKNPNETKARAKAIRSKIRSVKDFKKYLEEDSYAFLSHDNESFYDRAYLSQIYGASFAQSLFSLDEGTISEPLFSGAGYHLVLVRKRIKSNFLPFATVRESVARDYKAEESEEVRSAYVQKLKEHARISIFPLNKKKQKVEASQ